MTVVDARRRKILAGGAAATALWVAPSVTTLDRVGAATGSCGSPGVQLDWSDQRDNSTPGTITAADGTRVTFTLLAATSPGNDNFEVRHKKEGGLEDMLWLEMNKGRSSDFVRIRIDFDRPVAVCFTLISVDRKNQSWEDTVEIVGTDGGTPVDLGPGDLFLFGTATTYLGPNTVRGVNEVKGKSDAGNVDVLYPAPVDRVVVTYSDVTDWDKKQFVGIHDLRWC